MWSSILKEAPRTMTLAELDSGTYRRLLTVRDLHSFRVRVEQTDLMVSCTGDLSARTLALVHRYRRQLEVYICAHPAFRLALTPLPPDPRAPAIVQAMLAAAAAAGVGPMAAVAGALAEFVGNDLRRMSPEVIIENGGDIFICSARRRECLILAENAQVQGITVGIDSRGAPLGVCTSSGTLGHSLSLGRADAVTAVAPSALFADAAATAIANMVQSSRDIEAAIAAARRMKLTGVVILAAEAIGVWGDIELMG